jgi:hypothetical protein
MKFLIPRRPSASMVVATLALVVAASGTAVAGVRLAIGDKLIRPHSLSGNRLRNHSVTGTQVAAGTLGQVRSAKNADHAFVAGSAENAVNAQDAFSATNAVNAQNANTVGGQSASSFLPASSRVGTNGVVKVAAGSGPVTLFTFGPFTVTLTCDKSGSTTTVTMNGGSGEGGSFVGGGAPVDTPNTFVQVGPTVSGAGAHATSASGIHFEAPSGAEAILSASAGINSLGTDCWASWVGMR